MTYLDAVKEYIKDLLEKNYSNKSLKRTRSILTNWFSYSLALLHPDILEMMKRIEKPVFFNMQRYFQNTNSRRIKAVKHFLSILRSNNKIIYLNLNAFLKEYKQQFLDSDKLSKIKTYDLKLFFRAIALLLPIESLNKRISNEGITLLMDLKINRASGIITRFLIFCYDRHLLNFNPYLKNKEVYSRCYEENFIGDYKGLYRGYLKKYINYLKYEKNYADGGIDYRVRKLKIFTKYLDFNRIKKPDSIIVNKFLKMKGKEGISDKTLSYYLYEIKYFFKFLNEKKFMNINPELDLRIKYIDNVTKNVLTQQEVYKILDFFDEKIYQTKNPKDIYTMKTYFRLVRDNLIFQFFVFLGLRLKELASIKVKDIDFSNKSIEITGKGNRSVKQKITEIKIDSYVWKSLTEYLKIKNYPGQEYLFISWNGTDLTNSGINRIIHFRTKEAGINKKISPHRLRATCASLYIKKGVDPLTLKNIMRHNSISTTIDKYAQLTEEELRKIWKQTNPLNEVLDED